MTSSSRDWLGWHRAYDDASSPLSRRLRLVQAHITGWLDSRDEAQLTVVSACAGQGQDLLQVLAVRPDAGRVRGTLLETDPANVALAAQAVEHAGLGGIDVVQGDAGDPTSYVDRVPADLVLMAGVFGNIGDADVCRTVAALPQLCAAGATVIWTRTRRAPDFTPTIRRRLTTAGFTELAFDAPDDVLFTVGAHRFMSEPVPLALGSRLFTFL